MADTLTDFLALPWPVVAVVVAFVFSGAAVGLVSFFVFGVYLITRVPPFAFILRRSLWGMIEPIQEYAEQQVRDIVAEEIGPVVRAVFPPDGPSLREDVETAQTTAIAARDRASRLQQTLLAHEHRQDRFDEQLRRFTGNVVAPPDAMVRQTEDSER